MVKKKESAKTLAEGRLPYTDLPNHQQNVYSLNDVVQKDFFSVDFHDPAFKTALQSFIDKKKTVKKVSAAVEFFQNGEKNFGTECDICHASLGSVEDSFIDVQLWRKIPEADRPVHLDYQNWLLSYADDNPWAAAVTQLVILRDKETDMPEAIFFPTLKNCPDPALVTNLVITLRQCTEDKAFVEYWKKQRALGLSRRASAYCKNAGLYDSNHQQFSYITPVYNRYFNYPSYAQFPVSTFSTYCNKQCWGNDVSAANQTLIDNIKETEKE